MYKSNPSKSSWKYFFGFRVPKTGGSKQTGSASDSDSIVDIVEFKNGWYNNSAGGDAKDDDEVLKDYIQFKHDNHNSWLFDIDTMHDTINPHKMPVDSINDFLVKGGNKYINFSKSKSVETIQNKIETAKILNRNDIDTLDDKYTIVKDYGPGSHLLTLDCLIDSASTPSIKKFLKKKGDVFNIQERGSCIGNANNGPKLRTFDLTPSTKSCVDNNSSISGVDISLYQYLYDKYSDSSFFPKPDETSSEDKNLILLNYIWQLNLYYCISKCVEPNNPSKYSKALLTLNRLAFTGFEKTPGSFVPKFSYKHNNGDISAIQNEFLQRLVDKNYVKDNIETKINNLNEKKQFVFNISQAEVAKHIINILQKRNLNDDKNAYNAANIISRNDGENVKDKDKTIKVLTNYYFNFFGENKTDDQTYVQYIFMLRLLKFMGDRSHIVMAKLVEKASGKDDDILSPILYTGERPLQVSSINEGLNTVMQYVSVHNQVRTALGADRVESKQFLFCNSGLKPKEFSKLVCSKIISAFCWYYVKTNGNEPSDNYTIINTITSTSATSLSISLSISLRITFNKDNIVYIDFDDNDSIDFFTSDDQKKALSSLENVSFNKVVDNNNNNNIAFVQDIEGLTSQISIEGNVPIILTNFFRDIDTTDIDNNKKLWQDYKVINNIEFGNMFTEFYGNTIKKLSGKKHLLELRRWIFQMLSINDKRPKANISIDETKNNPKAAFFYFLCTSEEFGQGRSTLLILNTLEKALKQLKTLYDIYDKKQETNPLLKQKAKNAYEDLCFKLSSIKPVVDLFHAVNLKVNLGDSETETEIKDKIKCHIDDERNFNVSDDNLNNKLAVSDYLFNTGFKDNLNEIPNNDNSSTMTFRTETGEWNKYCCNPKLLSRNGILESNTNYMTRNPIYGSDSDKQKNNNNCVVNHDSRLNIYNKLLDIRELFYTSQLFKTDSAKEEIENIQKETIIEEVCLDTIEDNSELIQAVLSDRTPSSSSDVSASSEFILSSDTKTKIDVNYKNLFDKISENYDYYKSDDTTLDKRKNDLIELGKRFFRKGYEFYNYYTSGAVEPMDESTVGGNLSMVGGASLDPLKESEWSEIENHFLFNCIVEYLINIHFEKYLEDNGNSPTITNNYFSGFNFTNSKFSKGLYNSKEYVDSALRARRMNESLMFMGSQFAESRAAARYIDIIDTIDTINPYTPIPKLSDLNMYIDLFDSSIYSFPVTKDLHITIINAAKEQIEQRLSIEGDISPPLKKARSDTSPPETPQLTEGPLAVPVTDSQATPQPPQPPPPRPQPRRLDFDSQESQT